MSLHIYIYISVCVHIHTYIYRERERDRERERESYPSRMILKAVSRLGVATVIVLVGLRAYRACGLSSLVRLMV